VLVDDDSKRQEMILELSGKVLGITVYKKSWKTTFSEIASSYSCTTRILSSAFQYSNNLLTMSQVFDLYDEYILRMSNPDCADTEGPGSCAYMATFSPYETLTTAIPGNATTIRNNQENMRALETYYFETQDLLSDVDRILAVPGDYNIGNDVDAFSSPNDWTRDSLVNWRNQVKGYQNTTTTAWGRCYLNILNCTAGPVGKGLPTWLSLKNALPTRKFILPQDCASLADKFGTTDDGEYTLYLGGNATRNYQVYCQDMATSVPKTFLILGNTSANTATPTWNFATYRNGSDGAVSRTFESLEVEPKYDPSTGTFYLRVVPGQKSHTAFAVTESFPVGTDTTWIASTVTPLVANAHGGATATANLNLEGTPFVIPADISITEDPTCTPLTVVLSPDGHNIDVEATGDLICNAGVPNLLLAWGSP